MLDIKELSLNELEDILKSWSVPKYCARQIFLWVYQKGILDFSGMSNLPLDLRNRLKGEFYISSLKATDVLKSKDGTEKFLFELADKNLIEAVAIPADKRVTGCVSSQVGCKFSCKFCASGILGFKRNLTAGEILDEVLHLKNNSLDKKLTHIVFMGTGEPLDNYDNVLRAIRVINSPGGFNIGARRITISTSGIIPGIEKLAKEDLQIELSISLHAADDNIRSALMPVNKIYPLSKLITACRDYIKLTDRQITFEYVLIKGLNSDLHNAKKLCIILRELRLVKVNLIPANNISELGIASPEKQEIFKFKNYLLKSGIQVTLRKERGADIEAACGQLRLRYEKK